MSERLFVGDFRGILRRLPDDLWIVTDPPYNIGYRYPDYDDTQDDYLGLFQALAGRRCVIIHYPEAFFEFAPLLGDPRRLVSWCYNSNLAKQWRMIGWFNCEPDLSKMRQPYKNITDSRVMKLIAQGAEGPPLYDWWNVELVKNVSSEKEPYTNQIPEEIIRRILLTTVPEGALVFDPFCGSGTVPAVAKRLGYQWCASDVSETAIAIARERIERPSLLEQPA